MGRGVDPGGGGGQGAEPPHPPLKCWGGGKHIVLPPYNFDNLKK